MSSCSETTIATGINITHRVLVPDANGGGKTGLSDVSLSVQDLSDDDWLDFNDNTFKAAGWTTRTVNMSEVSATLDAGRYKYALTSNVWTAGDYLFRVDVVSQNNMVILFTLTLGSVANDVAAILTDTGTTLPATLAQLVAAVITNAAGVDVAADIIAVKAVADATLTDTGTTLFNIVSSILTDTGTTIPALITARTLLAAAYFDVTTDTVDVGKINGEGTSLINLQKICINHVPGNC